MSPSSSPSVFLEKELKIDAAEAVSGKIKIFIRYCMPLAAFFLILRTGYSVKVFELLAVIMGAALCMDTEARNAFRKIWPRARVYAACGILLVALVAAAQAQVYFWFGISTINAETLVNFIRLIFNLYIFFLTAFIVYYDKKTILPICGAMLISPLFILPAHWDFREGVYISGGRLTGFLQTPIMFGFWMAAIFIIGIGLSMSFKQLWKKFVVVALLVVVSNFIFWSASRAAWLAVAIGLTLFLLFYAGQRKWRSVGALVLICLITISLGYAFLPHQELKMKEYVGNRLLNFATSIATLRPNDVQSQIQTRAWPEVLGFVASHPLGVGFNGVSGNADRDSSGPEAHLPSNNSFLEVALYGGWGALCMFLFILCKLGFEAVRAMYKTALRPLPDMSVALFIVGVVVIVDIFFTNAFLWRHVWFLLGMALGVVWLSEPIRAPLALPQGRV